MLLHVWMLFVEIMICYYMDYRTHYHLVVYVFNECVQLSLDYDIDPLVHVWHIQHYLSIDYDSDGSHLEMGGHIEYSIILQWYIDFWTIVKPFNCFTIYNELFTDTSTYMH